MKSLITIVCISLTALVMSCGGGGQGANSAAAAPAAPEIAWQEISQAGELAKAQGKDIFVFVYAPWCPKCEAMKMEAFVDKEFTEIVNTHFIPIKINAQESEEIVWGGESLGNPNFDHSKEFTDQNSYHEIVSKIGAESIPNVVVLDYNLNNFASILGLRDAKTLTSWLKINTHRF